MKTLFDTSTLVAALLRTHARHAWAVEWLQRARRHEFPSVVGAHTFAEFYAVLTAMPVSPRITGRAALRLIKENVLSCCEVVELTQEDYRAILEHLAGAGLVGGIVYDALAAHSARKAGAERLLTLNPKDFLRAYPDMKPLVVAP